MTDCKSVTRRIFLLIIIIASTLSLCAQNLAQHNWLFGNSNNGIKFNRANNKPALITTKATPFGTGGSAVATDPATADLFFYTDGNNVYDATNALMTNGAGLNANAAANQPVTICAIPGQTNKYFIFTNTANFTTPGSISTSIVDMAQFGNSVFPSPPLGAVDLPTKNTAVPGLTNVSEGMIIIPHVNNTDFWLITQVNGTTTYNATLINAASFTAGTFTTTAVTGIGKAMTVANFSYSKKLKKIAVSPQIAGTDVAILNFDNTGVPIPFTFDSFIANSGTATTGNQSIYDVQWDNKGQYLYLSRTGDVGVQPDLLQYDASNPTITLASILPAPVSKSYGLQLGPDSAIYYLYQNAGGAFLVDKFTKTDTVASAVIRTATPFGATTDFKGTQFPEFLPLDKVKQKVDFTYNEKPNCQNNITSFYPNVTPNADSLQWTFGDGKDTTTWSPNHTYTTSGSFNVTLKAFYQGQEKDTTKSITITAFSLKLTLVSDTTACECQLPARQHLSGTCALPNFSVTAKVSGGSGTPTYLWSNGETTGTLHPDSAGYYYVVVKDASGCSTYAGVNVKEFELQDQRENIWYFGDHAGIDFNVTPAKALSSSAMTAPQGCAIACDRNGQVIFYTDGNQVWDKNNAQIASGIGGDPLSAQSAIIIPVTGDETLYYIFTTQAINGTSQNEMRYSLYDLKKDSVVIQNVLLFSKSTEHLTGNANWVIAHEYGNNTFRAYPVSIKGIGDPVYSALGSDASFESLQNGQGYMKLGSNTKNNLAVALSTPGTSNFVELFDFTDSTGIVSNYRKIDLKTPAGQVYGVEFSGGGNKLFATIDGPTPSLLFEYSIDSLGQTHLKQKTSVPAQLGAIQLAPNGQVFVAVNDPGDNAYLGTIAANDDTTQVSAFTLKGFTLAAGTNSTLGLPNFRQQQSNAFGGPAFTFTGICVGDTTHFVGTSRDPIDKFQWYFGDGGSSTDASPTHYYAAAGKYNVTMILYNRCPNSRDSIIQTVIINPPPPLPTLKASSALCVGPIVLNANSNNLPGTTYLWSTGDTTKLLTVTKPTITLSVTNTDSKGCSSTAKGVVGDARPKLELGPDQTLCQGTAPAPVLNAAWPGATYAWTVPTGVTPSPADSARQIVSVDSISTLALQKYKVVVSVVIDPLTSKTCSNSDSVTFTINPTPTFMFKGVNPALGCGTPTGNLTLTMLKPVGDLFSYSIFGDTTINGQDQPAGTIITDNLARAGIYYAFVTDQVSQCGATKQVTLSDNSVSLTITRPLTTCSAIAITATTTIGTPFNYQVTDSKGTVVDSKTGVTTSSFSTIPLPLGFYTLQAKSGHCTASDTVTIQNTSPKLVFSITPDVCDSPQTLTAATTAPGTPSYTWSPLAEIAGGQGTNVVTLSPGAGPRTYSVVGLLAGYCSTEQSIAITIPPTYTPSFTQAGNCTVQATLTALPAGSYSYVWYVQDPTSGVFNLVGTGPQILVSTTATYAVDVSDANGCTKRSPAQVVNVYGDLSIGLSATQACDDDSPFTLTATTNDPTVTYTWFLNNTVIAGQTSPTLVQTQKSTTAVTYKVRIATATCKDSTTLIVIPAPVPVGKLPDTGVICDDPTNKNPLTNQVILHAGDKFTTYSWFKNGLSETDTDSTFTVISSGTYKVDLTNVFGCKGSDQTIILSQCEPVVTAPTAFRPGSGVAQDKQFSIFTFFIEDTGFQIFIFNRWGEMIYQSSDRTFKWDGTVSGSGQLSPGGTYAYVIKYISSYRPDEGVQEKHGGVVLLR